MPSLTLFSSPNGPHYWAQACRELSKADPVMKKIIQEYGALSSLTSRGDAFYTLMRSIAGQQISVKAADAIWGRLQERIQPFTPERLLEVGDEAVRACGLTNNKTKFARAVAEYLTNNPNAAADWLAMEPEAAIKSLTAIHGIGRWTAEMVLMFHQMRPDIFPLDDIGLRKALYNHYNGGQPLTMPEMEAIGARLAPWRTVATWFFWRSLDPVPVEY